MRYFGRMEEKRPELETSEGNAGFPLCPFGKARFKNINSYSTHPSDLEKKIALYLL